jgi:hypothetical protein
MKPARGTLSQSQRLIIVDGMLCFVLLIVVLQLWLFTATMESYLGGDRAIVWPAALVSLACLGLNIGMIYYLARLDRSYDVTS